MSIGMNAQNGQSLSGIDHIRQSIVDILSTRIGTRLMMPQYGSRIPELIDQPINELTKSRIVAATAGAIRRFEKRFRVDRVVVVDHQPGIVSVDLYGQYLANGDVIKLEGVVI